MPRTFRFSHYYIVFWLWVGGGLVSCNAPAVEQERGAATSSGTTATWTPTTVKHATGFRLEYRADCKVLSIFNPFAARPDTARYVLVPRGSARPEAYPGSPVIEIPIRSLVGMSSMHVALAEFLGADSLLVGLGGTQYVYSGKVRRRIAAGKVAEVGTDNALNEELLVALRPDLVMVMGSAEAPTQRFDRLHAAGVSVLVNSEWVENTPLGRAEWVKVLAALLNAEAQVNEKFGRLEREYQRLVALAATAPARPSVIINMPYKDTWYMPGGRSFQAQFLRDAGAAYAWAPDTSSGSLPLSFEAVYPVALAADYWLNTGTATKRADILGQDTRYQEFNAYRRGNLFNNNKRTNAQGSNDYWESSAVHPDLVLADLIRILHPTLLPQHKLVYYQAVN